MPGLTILSPSSDIWRHLNVGHTIRAKWWRVPVDQVPRELDHEAQLQWLFAWWERIDEWITANRPVDERPVALAGDG